ncbi:MAG TPA: ATP-binding protein [Dongiaceae bacterium]|nr:ATP-binding protein [Dongiaceae bacterium]
MPVAADGLNQSLESGLGTAPFAHAAEHLLAEFGRLRLRLRREVLRLRAAGLYTEDNFRGLYVSDEQVDALLSERAAQRAGNNGGSAPASPMAGLQRRLEETEREISARLEASFETGVPLPLQRLAELFGLSDFERDALLLCVAAEVDLRFETLYAYAQNDVTRKRPTPDLVLRLFCDSVEERLERRAAFAEEAALFTPPLVRFADDAQNREPALLARPLKAEERIVRFLLGQPALEGRLRPFTRRIECSHRLSELQLPERLAAELSSAARSFGREGGVLFFAGPGGAGKGAAAAALAAEEGRPLLVADLRQARAAEAPLTALLVLLRREALLQGADLHLAHAEALLGDDPSQRPHALALPQQLPAAPLLLSVASEVPWPVPGSPLGTRCLTFDFPIPAFPARTRLWQDALRDSSTRMASDVDPAVLARKFVLTGGQIQAACREACDRTRPEGGDRTVSLAELESAARAQSNQGLRLLAQKVACACAWSDLVLPPRPWQQLRELCAAEKHRQLVYSQWGFERRLSLGKGLNVLLCGPSGTGKTMAAGILARELGLDLYKIDLSTVVSKYIGETEKQLSQIFREARSSNAILFFDEADALFGKRSEVKDAHDRYANVEVAYLLQKMEEYEGIVLLATNFRRNLDEAFTRRVHHIIEFPLPDAEHREKLWRGLLPPQAPVAEDVNFGFLARQFELAGGDIRNIVLAAAFLAAEQGAPMRMEHLVVATSRELQKLGRLAGRSEFREYYELLQRYT